jgi:hypothetical protein
MRPGGVRSTYRDRVVDRRLPTGYGGVNFYPSRCQVREMLERGRQQVTDHLDARALGRARTGFSITRGGRHRPVLRLGRE